MMLQGDAKRAYQRVYMRRKRAGKPTVNPKPWKPTKRMVDQVRYWLRTGAPQSLTGRKIIEGLDPTDEHEALRRYKAHLDEHERERSRHPRRSAARSAANQHPTSAPWLAAPPIR
jgi:hypothetical protein